jgi:hypothetical protein
VRHHHVEVALVHRHVGGFADRAARVVEVRAGLRQLDEVAEILDRAEAAAAVQIHHEGAAVGGCEDHGFPTDFNVVRGIPGVLRELRGGRLQHLAQQARRELDQVALHIRPGPAPMVQRHGVVAELDPGLGQDAVGGVLDPDQVFLGQDVVGRDVAQDVGPTDAPALAAAFRCPCLPSAAPLFVHRHPPLDTSVKFAPERSGCWFICDTDVQESPLRSAHPARCAR